MELYNNFPLIKIIPATQVNASITAAFRALGHIPVVMNDVYIPNLFRPERMQIWYGGSGSGKSDAKATELLLKCIRQDFCRVLFLRKYHTQIRDSQFLLFKDLIKRYDLGAYFHVKEAEMDIICKINGNMLLSAGLDDVDKLKSVADITDAWIEEPLDKKGSILSSDFTELDRRLRSPLASNHIHLTFNPISRDSWIHDYFFKSDSYKPFTLRTTYKDNFYTPEAQAAQFDILKEKKPEEYAVYALGEWGSLKHGLVFPEYKIIKEMPKALKRRGYGLDWGFYPDPCALVDCGINGGNLYIDEVLYENNLTSTTRAELMRKRGVSRYAKIVADRNPEAIAELKSKGFPFIMPADKGPGSVKAGLDALKMFNIHITERSKNIKKELDNYSWGVDRRTGEPSGEPEDAFNHAIDAVRYWYMSGAKKLVGFL